MTQQKVATAKPTGERPTVAVLGTGIIGAPVARNLERAGYRVQAWNRSPAKAQVLATADGVTVPDPRGRGLRSAGDHHAAEGRTRRT